MKAVAEVIGVSRSNLIERLRDRPKKRLGRPPLPDDELVADIKAVIVELPLALPATNVFHSWSSLWAHLMSPLPSTK